MTVAEAARRLRQLRADPVEVLRLLAVGTPPDLLDGALVTQVLARTADLVEAAQAERPVAGDISDAWEPWLEDLVGLCRSVAGAESDPWAKDDQHDLVAGARAIADDLTRAEGRWAADQERRERLNARRVDAGLAMPVAVEVERVQGAGEGGVGNLRVGPETTIGQADAHGRGSRAPDQGGPSDG